MLVSNDTATYDYVIVGAGSAGCVLANRLSENGRYSVLLLEAGGSDNRFWIKVPLGYAFTFSDPALNWCYTTEADPGLNDREAYWPRGRVIGGSSSINAMAYLRGLPRDFDDWENAGAKGWNWKAVKSAYEEFETHSELDSDGNRSVRGDGPLWIWDSSDQMHPFSHRFLDAARDMGWPVSKNLNSDDYEGVTMLRSTVRDGRRWSSADAFLNPAKSRKNLHIISNALVERIELEGKKATGVSYSVGGKKIAARAMREVIVSGGAINSPQLLQLSGIGPAKLLKQHGIEVNLDHPKVGQGLQDHLGVSHLYRSSVPTANAILGNQFGRLRAGIQYLLTRKGPLSVPINQCSGLVRTDKKLKDPDLQIYCNPASYGRNKNGKTVVDRESGFVLCFQPCRPTSRGSINITSADPRQKPEIQPNSLSTKEDKETVIRGGHILKALAETPAIRDVTKERLSPDITSMSGDEMLENFKANAETVFHPCGTCQMGNDRKNSVVDARLRVHGISGLRVVDASVFPNITSGNTNAPSIMVGWKASEMILEDAAGKP